jgi:hypothetical protein
MPIRRHRQDRGAVLMQVLFGLGFAIVMTPIILKEIRQYNRQIAREEIISQLDLAAKVATSFLSFEKGAFHIGCQTYSSEAMRDIFDRYGAKDTSMTNSLGQSYFFIACKRDTGEKVSENGIERPVYAIEAVIGADGAPISAAELGEIGEYLLDKGLVVDNEGNTLSNYDILLTDQMKLELSNHESAFVMYVNETTSYTDYMHADILPTANGNALIANTMLTSLEMNNHDISGIFRLSAREIAIEYVMRIDSAAGIYASFSYPLSVGGPFALEGDFGNASNPDMANSFAGETLPFETGEITFESAAIDGDAIIDRINMPSDELYANILRTNTMSVSGDMEVIGNGATFGASALSARAITAATWDENIIEQIDLDDAKTTAESQILVGAYDADLGSFKSGESALVKPGGISEAADICWWPASGPAQCISDGIIAIYQDVMCAWTNFLMITGDEASASAARAECGR